MSKALDELAKELDKDQGTYTEIGFKHELSNVTFLRDELKKLKEGFYMNYNLIELPNTKEEIINVIDAIWIDNKWISKVVIYLDRQMPVYWSKSMLCTIEGSVLSIGFHCSAMPLDDFNALQEYFKERK